MCGIIGGFKEIIDYNSVLKKMSHRGPDFSDLMHTEHLTFGHARLSIQDLSSLGNQPCVLNDGSIFVFNGEIYNHLELRKTHNLNCRGNGDVETLKALFETQDAISVIKQLNGMFAIAYFDNNSKEITLSRDYFGEKPLYYGFIQSKLIFSSELLPIIKTLPEEFKNQKFKSDLYERYGFWPNDTSPFRNFKKVLPGQIIRFDKSGQPHFIVNRNLPPSNTSYKFKNIFKNIRESVHDSLISDVEVGAFLSGGIDSTIVTALASKNIPGIKAFTLGHKTKDSESDKANRTTRKLGIDHRVIFWEDQNITETINEIIEKLDIPIADSSILPTYIISKHASKYCKVILTGDGADEIFCGYRRYWTYSLIYFLIKSPIRKYLHLFFHKLKIFKNRTFNTFGEFYFYLEAYNRNKVSRDTINDIRTNENMRIWDVTEYLPNDILTKVDRASMMNSLETRAPFLNKRIIINGLYKPRFLNFPTKFPLRLYAVILTRDFSYLFDRKKGFSIDISHIIQNSLHEEIKTLFNDADLHAAIGIDHREAINALNKCDNNHYLYRFIWNRYILLKWYKTHLT